MNERILREVFEEIELAFSRCDNKGWDAPFIECYRPDGTAELIWKDKRYLMTLKEES